MGYILKLAGWYPSRVDPLTGDFVQRHARCIAPYEKVIVLFLVKDASLLPSSVDIQRSDEGNLTEYIVYYSASGPFGRGLSLFRYLLLGHRMVRRIQKEHGTPALVHVSIIWKAGLLGLYLKKRFGWKYLLTEHWAGYTRQNPQGLHTQSWLVRTIYKKVYKSADLFLPVSRDLAQQVGRWYPGISFQVVYNVVNTDLFYYRPFARSSGQRSGPPHNTRVVKKCLHVSSLNYQKNIEGILRVLEQLSATREDIEITLTGPVPPDVRRRLSERGLLDKKVFLTGVLTYPEVASLMRESDLFFLFSRYENQPCVVLEALCCGLPIIATSVGGLPEIIDATNGMLVESEREDQLLNAFNTMLDGYGSYDQGKISADARAKFSYSVVGRQLSDIYRSRATRSI